MHNILHIHLQPNSSKDQIIGYLDNIVKIKIIAPAKDNKANQYLIKYLSKVLNISKKDLKLIKGFKSRQKQVLITNITKKILEQKLEYLISQK